MNVGSPPSDDDDSPSDRTPSHHRRKSAGPDWATTLCDAASSIRGIVSDVDGVMTDGSIWYGEDGTELKRFHVRDGLAIKRWIAAGNHFGVITARGGEAVRRRMNELGVTDVVERSSDKRVDFQTMRNAWRLDAEETAFVGDDLADARSMIASGLGVAPEDACLDVLTLADVVVPVVGGGGVLRSLIETLMRANGTWEVPDEAMNPKADVKTTPDGDSPRRAPDDATTPDHVD